MNTKVARQIEEMKKLKNQVYSRMREYTLNFL